MTVLFMTFLVGTLFGAIPRIENSNEGYKLLEDAKITLYRLKRMGEPWSKIYTSSPRFLRLPTGEMFVYESTPAHKWVYFFSQNGKLKETKKPSPNSTGKPGVVTSILSEYTTPQGEFVTFDIGRRISFFSKDGDFLRSLLLPCFNRGMTRAVINKNTLAFAGIQVDEKKQMFPWFAMLEIDNPEKGLVTKAFCKDAYREAEAKGKILSVFVVENISGLSTGHIACNVSTYPDIYLVSPEGKVLMEDAIPLHFKSIKGSSTLGIDDWADLEMPCGSDKSLPDTVENWLKTWTHSYGVYEYSNHTLVVPRVLYPVFYLDCYSYSDKDIKYLGYASTTKPFLFADSSGVYLLERDDDTSIVIGKYEIVPSNYHEFWTAEWIKDSLAAEEALGINRVNPTTKSSDTVTLTQKEIQYVTKIDSVILTSTSGSEYLLTDSLAPGKGHVLVFATPQNCRTPEALDSARSYINRNPGFDYTLIYTHPYGDELTSFIRIKRSYADYPILTNTDRANLENVVKSNLAMFVVSRDGTIIEKFD